ncbi:hypothetical protein ACIQUQ_31340 [Streptomyces sp. NPDC101118]|uniref:hypothetical protein n=1 Tax=Streptomyces sp. NPDC101118 TaxID=3366109 RepID=UPI00382A2999
MWPGQQPPGGEQNPQDANQNPYQQPAQPGQPGQPPNPYQQPAGEGGYGYPQQPPAAPQQGGYGYPQQPPAAPQEGYGYPQQPPAPPQEGYGYPQQGGFGQPGPYAQQPPTAEQWAYQQPYDPYGQEPSDGRKKTTMIAIIATSVVVVAAAVMGAYVLTRDDDKKDEADGKPSAKPSASASASASANPRGGGDLKPTVPGWKVVVNPKYGTAFDVPPEWKVETPDTYIGFADEKKDTGQPIISMSAPASLKEQWCIVDSDKDGDEEDYSLAGSGTKGGQGAKDTAEAARNEAGNWVWAAYAQTEPKGTVKVTKAKPYTTKSGLKGHYATATANGVKKEHKCSTDGKSIAFSFKNAKGDFSSWVLYAPNNVKDEIPHATVKKIMSTVRLTNG